MTSPTIRITLDPDSQVCRRRLGPLPWAVLEELALCAQPDPTGWIAAIGVRGLAAAVGVAKDTANRAVATLRSAGLVTPDRIKTRDGRWLSAYRLNLPDGITVHSCPALHDSYGSGPNKDDSPGPDRPDSSRLPAPPINESTVQIQPPDRRRAHERPKAPRKPSGNVVQASLFDNPDPDTD